MLSWMNVESRDDYRKRASAASALWRWFLKDYRT
jgi:hypothetical protein